MISPSSNNFPYKPNILGCYRLSPIYIRFIGFLSKIEIFKVYKKNSIWKSKIHNKNVKEKNWWFRPPIG